MSQVTPETKSERIARILEAEIRSGSIGNGEALSSEKLLVERFAVSRTTVRKGLGILASKGLIATKVGIGSFVTYGGTIIDSGPGWSVALSEHNARVGTRILCVDRRPMDIAPAAQTLPEALTGEVLAVDRIRFREETGKVLTLERARVPWRPEFEQILRDGLEGGSLSTTLRNFGLEPAMGEEWANVLPALSQVDADAMDRTAGEAMLRLRRLTRSGDGDVVEYVESLLDPDHFGLHMEF